jgi:hypothetical protein
MIHLGKLGSERVSLNGHERMRCKEQFHGAAVADREEVSHLSDYLAGRILARKFSKGVSEGSYGLNVNQVCQSSSHQLSPYHYLRTDLTLLLGASGTKLLNKTWGKYRLAPTERDRSRLRPCLMKLFSVAARIAAPKGVGRALKRLVADFEKAYFPVVDQELNNHRKTSQRFALLSVLQSGQGSHLLHGILGDPDGQEQTLTRAKNSFPSGHIEQDPAVSRRQFLFETAYRSKSWSEAYRQARVLKCLMPNSARHRTVNRRMGRVFQGILGSGCPRAKKKQLLTDLASLSELATQRRVRCALDALGSRTSGCRPGQVERTTLELLSPGDPWWRVSLNRLYRHEPVPERWTDDLRTLYQSEPTLRGFCRATLNILRYSGARAHYNLARNGLKQTCFPLNKNLSRARLERVRKAVLEWKGLLPPKIVSETSKYGSPVQLTSDQWKFISEVCGTLGTEAPLRAMSRYQTQPARIWHSVLCLSPEFQNCSTAEQRFLLARTLFRSASGLDDLERRSLALSTPAKILVRALDYAEWAGHRPDVLEEFRDNNPGKDLVQVALEEMYWSTGDSVYRRFCEMCRHGGWCPLFDREADLFAACFADIVSASQALVKVALWNKHITQVCHKQGLAPLLSAGRECPVLCMRLQTLWMTVADEVQRVDRVCPTSPNKVLR